MTQVQHSILAATSYFDLELAFPVKKMKGA